MAKRIRDTGKTHPRVPPELLIDALGAEMADAYLPGFFLDLQRRLMVRIVVEFTEIDDVVVVECFGCGNRWRRQKDELRQLSPLEVLAYSAAQPLSDGVDENVGHDPEAST